MAFATTFVASPGARMRRAVWLVLCGIMLLTSLTGCTTFGSVCSANWWTGNLGDEQPVNHVLVRWDNRVRTAQDSENLGNTLRGLVGRIYLLSEESQLGLDAHGEIVVAMFDMTWVSKGQKPTPIAEWHFLQKDLKQLKRKDIAGDGYTLFLPWETYSPNVKVVKLMAAYFPVKGTEKGTAQLADDSVLTLQTGDQAVLTSQPLDHQPDLRAFMQPQVSPQPGPQIAQPRPQYVPVTQKEQIVSTPAQRLQPGPQVQYPPTQPGAQVQYLPAEGGTLPTQVQYLPVLK